MQLKKIGKVIKMSQTEKPHILIVDDNALNLLLMQRQLNREFEVVTVNNGKDALNLLAEKHFDMVLLDIMMPQMNGPTVLKIIRSSPTLASLPVILVSAMPRHEYLAQGHDLNENDYFSKPMDFEHLAARIKQILGDES